MLPVLVLQEESLSPSHPAIVGGMGGGWGGGIHLSRALLTWPPTTHPWPQNEAPLLLVGGTLRAFGRLFHFVYSVRSAFLYLLPTRYIPFVSTFRCS